MSTPGEWFRRVRYLLNRRRLEEDLRREMDAHRELMPAPSRFGNTLRLREEARDVWGGRWLDDAAQDVRYAWRTLALSHRTFALTAVSMLAIGIGVTTAVFSVVSGLLLQPLPFPRPERLVQLHGTTSLRGPQWPAVMNLDTYRRDSASFEAIAGYEVGGRYLRDGAGTDRVMVVRTEPAFFSVLGVQPLHGRTYETAEDVSVVVISEAFWKRRLGGSTDILGRPLVLDGQPFTVAGIMPADFQFPYRSGSLLPGVAEHTRTDLWMPFDRPLSPRGRIGTVTARLKPGVSVAAAQKELDVIAKRLEAQYPDTNLGKGVAIVPLAREVVPAEIRRLLYLLFGAVAIVLALACANVANLSLARMTLRQREVAVRAALGASPFRLVRQFLTESLLLALGGGIAGVILAWWDPEVPASRRATSRAHEVRASTGVFAFMAGVCADCRRGVGGRPPHRSRRDPRSRSRNRAAMAPWSGPAPLAIRRRRSGARVRPASAPWSSSASLVWLRATDAESSR